MTSRFCLDLGTTTGWVYAQAEENIITSGTVNFKPNRFEGGGMRYLKFSRWLDNFQPSEVYFEEVRRHLGVDAAHAYGGFLATLTAWCEQHEIPYRGVPVGTIKKTVAGKGNANKQAVIEAVRSLGHDPKDDNEADALALFYTVTGDDFA
jgi:Holliday junction resolvasome RuvABC endonuclease subunit